MMQAMCGRLFVSLFIESGVEKVCLVDF